jgi:hypothetical protein
MRYVASMLIAVCMAGTPVLVGCDREVAHTEKTSTDSDGTVKKDETTVKQNDQGQTSKEQTHTVDKP